MLQNAGGLRNPCCQMSAVAHDSLTSGLYSIRALVKDGKSSDKSVLACIGCNSLSYRRQTTSKNSQVPLL